MSSIGLAVAIGSVAALAARWLRMPRVATFGPAGWAGLALFGGCAALLGLPLAAHPALGALAWSGYILAVDEAVFAVRGRSLLRSRPESFLWLATLSVFLWLPFEWYNLRLAGWYRSGLPAHPLRYLLLGWSFACIWPALLETASLFHALAFDNVRRHALGRPPSAPLACASAASGATLLLAPLAVPRLDLGEHLLPLASVGFLLLLEPWNAAVGRTGLWLEVRARNCSLLAALAGAGLFCGIWLDALNHLSRSKWHSLWPFIAAGTPFELPWTAYAVLPLFAWQAFAMYQFAAGVLDLPRCGAGTLCGDAADERAARRRPAALPPL
ncbi:MAG: hypothetical protein OXD30_06760 [Bryobacterales bacterium]|nr:hypothetical protein [Bryobacterales bacterium]